MSAKHETRPPEPRQYTEQQIAYALERVINRFRGDLATLKDCGLWSGNPAAIAVDFTEQIAGYVSEQDPVGSTAGPQSITAVSHIGEPAASLPQEKREPTAAYRLKNLQAAVFREILKTQTVAEIAFTLGVTAATVRKWADQHSPMSLKALCKCELLLNTRFMVYFESAEKG